MSTKISKKKPGENTMNAKKKQDIIFVVVMLGWAMIMFCLSFFYLNIKSFLMAFQDVNGDWTVKNITDTFERFTSEGGELMEGLLNSLKLLTFNVLLIPFHLTICYFLYKKIRGYRFFQIAFYLPGIIGGVVYAQLFREFIAADGIISTLLQKMGGDPLPNFLDSSKTTFGTILVYSFWLGWSGNMLLMGGALARIPLEVLEAAKLDGTNIWRELWTMILPLVWPTVSTFLILTLTGFISNQGSILLFDEHAMHGTWTLGYWLYYHMRVGGSAEWNLVSATGLVLTVTIVPVVMLVKKLIEKVTVVDY